MENGRPHGPQSSPDARPPRRRQVTSQTEHIDRDASGIQAVPELARTEEADDSRLVAFSIQSANELDGEPLAAADIQRVDQMEYADHRLVQ